jgi:hypothetical protein
MNINQALVVRGLFPLLTVIPIVACDGGSSGTASPNPSSSVQSAQCIAGWWRDDPGGACICPATSECAGGDCVSYNVVGFTNGATYYGGTVAVSATKATMSAIGQFDTGSFAIDGSTIAITRPQTPQYSPDFACTSGHLSLAGQALVPVDSTLASALSVATSGGKLTWSAYPVR